MNITVLIYAAADRPLTAGAREALGAARKLADASGGHVTAAVVGDRAAAEASIRHGADRALTVDCPVGREADRDVLLHAGHILCQQAGASFVLVPGDRTGWEIAPMLANRLGAGLVTDCIDMEVADGRVVLTKPVYGGKARARFAIGTDVKMALLRVGAFEAADADEARTGEVTAVELPPCPEAGRVRFVEFISEEGDGKGVPLEEARVVVAGGRGLGGPEPFADLEQLASLLGGALGASLAAVDAGWISPAHQIGQTGKSVAPDLYIAVGISGASQHVAGITGARTIVAVNKDEEAPIFNVAHIGVVGDFREVLPAFRQELEKLLASR